jgi:2,3-bisphosphoglycerate-dependent phosphoglycerate mutase
VMGICSGEESGAMVPDQPLPRGPERMEMVRLLPPPASAWDTPRALHSKLRTRIGEALGLRRIRQTLVGAWTAGIRNRQRHPRAAPTRPTGPWCGMIALGRRIRCQRTSRYAHGVTASVVLLIRHGAPEPPVPGSSGEKDDERPLTSEGLLAAERLAERMRAEPITAVFSSPYRRAVETVQPIASIHTLPVRTFDDLRERRLSPTPLAESAFLEALRRSREDPAFALPGGESANEVRLRGLRVLDRVRRDTPSGIAVAGTHGGLISILRWHLGEEFTIDEALAEPMLAIYSFRWDRDSWRIDPR